MSLKEAAQSLQPIQPKTDSIISIFGTEVTSMDLFQNLIHISSEGWDFRAGDPELWKFKSKLIVPGGRVLDLGSGLGGTSIPFALQDMEVTAYETNPDIVKAMSAVAENFDLPISVLNEDVKTADFGNDMYDTLILGQTFAHFESREEAFRVIKKAIGAVKPEGHILFRGNGKGDPEDNTSEDFYMHSCDCSGEMKMEPHLFFDPLELIHLMSESGIKIIHAQMVPQHGKPNIMYGENWEMSNDQFGDTVSLADLFNGVVEDQIERVDRTHDIITIIGRKN